MLVLPQVRVEFCFICLFSPNIQSRFCVDLVVFFFFFAFSFSWSTTISFRFPYTVPLKGKLTVLLRSLKLDSRVAKVETLKFREDREMRSAGIFMSLNQRFIYGGKNNNYSHNQLFVNARSKEVINVAVCCLCSQPEKLH